MAMGKSFRIYERDNSTNPYSVLLEQRSKDTSLLLESNVVAALTSQEKESIKRQYTKVLDAYGCLGVLQVNSEGGKHSYLVLVTGCISLGKVADSEIFKITQTGFLCLHKQPVEDEHISEVRKLLNSGTFYFSWSSAGDAIDITLCAQRRVKTKTTDNRFFWNKTMYLHMLRYGVACNEWLIKAMCGSVEIRTVYVGHRQGKAVIISRLSCERTGTRFHVRGVNDLGHVANFVETEQAIYMEDCVTSNVQIRGSVPLFWEQTGVQVGQHRVRMSRGPESSADAFDRHMKLIKQRYGHQTIVNLLGTSQVGAKESEGMLSTLYQQQQVNTKHTDIQHIVFDYHQECRGGNTKNLSKLRAAVEPYIRSYSAFYSKGNEIISEQSGTIRTNCLDCLDRTNCVQTFQGLLILMRQLEFLELAEKQQSVSRFEEVFKQMWVDNGNEVSKIYAGTGAIQGGSKFMDGARSAARTIQNNLLDTSKQEAIDVLLLGNTLNCQLSDRARSLLDPSVVHLNNNLIKEMCLRCHDYLESKPIRLGIGTYNVNGGKHFRSVVYKDLSLTDWLLDAHKISDPDLADDIPIDIFAIGFEEIVDLNASNIMAASTDNAKAWAEELQKVLSRENEYVLITYVQLVGVCLFVFTRPELTRFLRDVTIDSVKTGLGGATGNKGGVAIRCVLYNTSLCFICAHFAAGQSQVADRNSDYVEISKKLMFPTGTTLKSHDYVFWCGDFNYRIDMDKEQLKELIKENCLEDVLKCDQLLVQKEAGNIFSNCIEGPITFPPTYKYDLFSDDYDTSEKARAPAWTDRVLWKRRKFWPEEETPESWSQGRMVYYGRAELKQSDHRPVIALIDAQVSKAIEDKREAIFWQVVNEMGPSDGTVTVECVGKSSVLLDESSRMMLLEHLSQFGEVVVVRQVDDQIYIMYKEGKSAVRAVENGPLALSGVTFKFGLKTKEWKTLIENQIELCQNNTIPLCKYQSPNLERGSEIQWAPSPCGERLPPPTRPPQPVAKPKVTSMPAIPKRPESRRTPPESPARNTPPPPPCPQTPPPKHADKNPPPPPCPETPQRQTAPPLPRRPDSNSPLVRQGSSCDGDSSPPGLPAPSAPPPPIPPRSTAPPPVPNRNK